MDEIDQAKLDSYLSARGRWRRKFLQVGALGRRGLRGRTHRLRVVFLCVRERPRVR
jgi:hypothetical protein